MTDHVGGVQPRRHADPAYLARKLACIDEIHVKPLNDMVRRIQATHAGTPFFDPDSGGIHTRILLLLEAPGAKATDFVSPDNNDQTAANLLRLLHEADVPRIELCFWNVVPFYIGAEDRSKLRAAKQTDLDAGRPWVIELINLLPQLHTIVLMGRQAQKSRQLLRTIRPSVRILNAWHPSNRCLNSRPRRRAELLQTLRDAARV